ncbi:MAG: hypothetical protein K2Y25_06910 [Pseudomonadaceae bacterium]|jgi:hypothetical protein|nr:hypothetical protein [Pseudomonadaceae bacterium]
MNIAGYGYLASARSLSSPARASFRAVSAESQLGLESPAPADSLSSASKQVDAEDSKRLDPSGRAAPSAAEERSIELQVSQLSARDREVRAHEQAHSAVGGSYAGAPSYTFKRGPDGRSYAVGGEVAIDVGAIANDPAATIRKMEQVQRAALAPAEPSGQDRSIAARAQVLAAQARSELSVQQREAAASAIAEGKAQAAEREQAEQDKQAGKDKLAASEQDSRASNKTAQQDFALTPNLQVYRRVGALPQPDSLLHVVT